MSLPCIYCGSANKSDEHIIQKKLGGSRCIRQVCGQCNNSFAGIDSELAYRSPLALVRSHELNLPLEYAWISAPPESHLLVESAASPKFETFTPWPQLVLEGDRLSVYCALDDLRDLSIGRVRDVLVRHVKPAIQTWRQGLKAKRLHLDQVDESSVLSGYRLPPRLFARHRIWDFNDESNFQARFLSPLDLRRLLAAIEDAPAFSTRVKSSPLRPTSIISLRLNSQPILYLRALVKTALNIIEYLEPGTITPKGFAGAIWFVKDKITRPRHIRMARQFGFVEAQGVESISVPGCHVFRVTHDDYNWYVIGSWFGGRAGTYVSFPGPTRVPWRTATVQAPIRKQTWAVAKSKLLLPPAPAQLQMGGDMCNGPQKLDHWIR